MTERVVIRMACLVCDRTWHTVRDRAWLDREWAWHRRATGHDRRVTGPILLDPRRPTLRDRG